MKLETVAVQLYRNFVDAQRIAIESDVTCLVGKNESGKTTVLKALHRLKPANDDDTAFDLTTEYPRWRLARDRRKNPNLGETEPVEAIFSLDDDDRKVLGETYGLVIPTSAVCIAWRDYGNRYGASLECSVKDTATFVASTVGLSDDDLSSLTISDDFNAVVTSAKALAEEHRTAGATDRARTVTAFVTAFEQYDLLIRTEGVTVEQRDALWERVPSFFYFSNYATLPGETNLTELARKVATNEVLTVKERTVVSLLNHAGVKPEDFLDENYDSRKAELQAASIDLSREVFKYWKQNTDLTVVFDTDNLVSVAPTGGQIGSRFLKVELRDERHLVETNFDTRSSGFQWFFSFFAAFSEHQNSDRSIIVLLDEPGTSLHGDAQHEFVDYIFNELGASKQTIYTTHSQHMVDPTRYEKLRAVHDRATRENPDLGVEVTLANLSADAATLLPIESALGYSVSRHLFIGSGQHLAVEGSGDYVFIQRLTEYLTSQGRVGLDPRLSIIPVGSVDNMPAFVALLGRRLKVSALIDGARSGNRLARIKAAAEANDVPESAIVVCSDVDGMPTNADIEDLFTATDYLRLYNWALNVNVAESDLAATSEPILKKLMNHRGEVFDHALPAHELTRRREEFFASVQPTTLDNFEALFAKLNATVQA